MSRRRQRSRRRSRGETSVRGAKTRRTALCALVKAEEQRRRKSCHGLHDGQREVERGAHSLGSPVGEREEVAAKTDAGVQATHRPQQGRPRQAPAGPCMLPAGPLQAPRFCRVLHPAFSFRFLQHSGP